MDQKTGRYRCQVALLASAASLSCLPVAEARGELRSYTGPVSPLFGQTEPAPVGQTTTPVDRPSQSASNGDVNVAQEDIVIVGFRQSINSALAVKRRSVSAVDAIVAQDIANFPDQNLAESLQRIPGIAITRSGGEGNTITVRGLGPDFTRVRLNGMETVATTPDNTGRGFNFSVFASDLFNSVVVHKTAEAQLDEGSLGATVDLNTGNPLSYKKGLTVVGSAKAQYNDLNENVGPRVAGLIAYRDPDGVWAGSLSAAYATYKTAKPGTNTVGWQQARFNSVGGTACFTRPRTGGSYVPSAPCDEVALAYHPRIPRYGSLGDERERLGVTGSFQIAPTTTTVLSIDGLYAKYDLDHTEQFGQVLLRSNERAIDVIDYAIDPNTNTLTQATLANVGQRIENRRDTASTQFYQINGKLEQKVSDKLKINVFGGASRSVGYQPHGTNIILDSPTKITYKYDYAQQTSPYLQLDSSIGDYNAFQVTELRDDEQRTRNQFWTAKLDAEWTIADELKLAAGGSFRRFGFNSQGAARSTTYCASFGCSPGQLGFQLTDELSYQWTVPGVSAPQGVPLTYVMPDLSRVIDRLGFYNLPLIASSGSVRTVVEKTSTGWFQFNIESDLLGLRYAANAGVRYVKTQQSSTGINNAQSVKVSRDYDDWLPAINIAFFPAETVVIRTATAKVLKRPNLGDLTPGGSVNGFDYRASFGNPLIEPTRATTYDASVEWYFAPSALLSLAFFRKDIESFPISDTRQGSYESTGLPSSLILPTSPAGANPEAQPWTISGPVNGPGGVLQGVEIGFQLPLTFLPGFLRNTGFVGNATYIDSDFTYTVNGPATEAATASFPQLTPGQVTTGFLGASRWSYNATIYYEDEKFSLRGSAAYREGYNSGTGSYGNVLSGTNSTLNVDASARYQITKEIALTLEGINLTNEVDFPYVDEASGRINFYQSTGRVFLAGVRIGL